MLEYEYDKTTKYQEVKVMEEKIMEEIKSIERRIEWKTEDLDKAVEEFKEAAASYDAYHIATFLPGKIEEIARYRAEVEKLTEQKQMLEYMLSK